MAEITHELCGNNLDPPALWYYISVKSRQQCLSNSWYDKCMTQSQSSDFSQVQWIDIDTEADGQRIDNFLIKTLKGVPKSYIYRILRKGEVRVNKKRIKPDYRLASGDQLRLPPVRVAERDEARPAEGVLKWVAERILYQDKDLMVVNKPSGLAVHGGSGVNYGLIEALRALYPQEKGLELVHRLDRDTSGCILIAKKRSVLAELHRQVRDNQMEKVYLCLVRGHWPRRRTKVDLPLLKNTLSSGERMVRVDPAGKPSVSLMAIEQIYHDCTLLRVTLETGRTHQIRVHTAHSGHPIAGDPKYGDDEFNKHMKSLGLKRLFLHAAHLGFTHPGSGEVMSIEAPLDEELNKVLGQLPQV